MKFKREKKIGKQYNSRLRSWIFIIQIFYSMLIAVFGIMKWNWNIIVPVNNNHLQWWWVFHTFRNHLKFKLISHILCHSYPFRQIPNRTVPQRSEQKFCSKKCLFFVNWLSLRCWIFFFDAQCMALIWLSTHMIINILILLKTSLVISFMIMSNIQYVVINLPNCALLCGVAEPYK